MTFNPIRLRRNRIKAQKLARREHLWKMHLALYQSKCYLLRHGDLNSPGVQNRLDFLEELENALIEEIWSL